MDRAFEPADVEWRGLGLIPGTGLTLREEFGDLDASRAFDIRVPLAKENNGCRCGDVLRGLIRPKGCGLFQHWLKAILFVPLAE
jgi:hydrogenase expression/formation protein HypD